MSEDDRAPNEALNESPDDPMYERKLALDRLNHMWNTTNNPLFIWEALSYCLSNDSPGQPIPLFCRDYLRDTAINLRHLGWGRDIENPKKQIDTERALALVPQALSFSRPKSKSVFKRYKEEFAVMNAAFDAYLGRTNEADTSIYDRVKIGTKNLSGDRGRRELARGMTILGVKPPLEK